MDKKSYISVLKCAIFRLTTEKRDAEREVEELQQINNSSQMELQRLRNMLEVEKLVTPEVCEYVGSGEVSNFRGL